MISPQEMLINILKENSLKVDNGVFIYLSINFNQAAEEMQKFFILKEESINKQLSFIDKMDKSIQEINQLTDKIWRMHNHGRKD